ncbi:MAG: glycosyl transferase, partial [Halieaceae bacterium]|nr:glycosyl transferase [Halieaceae bacterium]
MSEFSLPPARPVTRFNAEMPLAQMTGELPKVSVVVVGYSMPDQLERTLYSLSLHYQRGVGAGDYEVLVLENDSGNNLGELRACGYPGDFRYFLREEKEPTP